MKSWIAIDRRIPGRTSQRHGLLQSILFVFLFKIASSLIFSSLSVAQSQSKEKINTNLTGVWNLYYQNSRVDVDTWSSDDKTTKNDNQESKLENSYKINQLPVGILSVVHKSGVWLIGFPPFGPNIRASTPAGGYKLGPPISKGPLEQIQLRVRPGANELEIWIVRDVTDSTGLKLGELGSASHSFEYEFTDFTLIRENQRKSAPALPSKGIF